MATETCSVCRRPFLVYHIEDKSRPARQVDIYCPYGPHIHRTEVSTRSYVCLEEGASPWSHLPRQPNPNNGEEHIS